MVVALKQYEPGHNISYKITCAPSKDQPAHLHSLISLCWAGSLWEAKDQNLLQMGSKDSDQTGWMHRLSTQADLSPLYAQTNLYVSWLI